MSSARTIGAAIVTMVPIAQSVPAPAQTSSHAPAVRPPPVVYAPPAPPAPRVYVPVAPPAPRMVQLPLPPGEKVTFQLSWQIEPQAADRTVLPVRGGQTVTAARLLPNRMWQLASDLVAADGQVVLPTGTQFVRADSRLNVGCSIRSLKVGAIEGILFNNERYVCVTDENYDGKLDHFFFKGETNAGMVAGLERVPQRIFAVGSGTVRMADPSLAVDTPKLELQYSHYAFLSKWILFQTCIRSGKACFPLVSTYGLKLRDVPGSFDVLGGAFEILEKNEGVVSVRMTRPFAPMTISFSN